MRWPAETATLDTGLAAVRGMVPPPAQALPADSDLAVVGPMARSAHDLTLLFDVMAGPDPLTLAGAYKLTLPPARHERLCDFRASAVFRHGRRRRATVAFVAVDALTALIAAVIAAVVYAPRQSRGMYGYGSPYGYTGSASKTSTGHRYDS